MSSWMVAHQEKNAPIHGSSIGQMPTMQRNGIPGSHQPSLPARARSGAGNPIECMLSGWGTIPERNYRSGGGSGARGGSAPIGESTTALGLGPIIKGPETAAGSIIRSHSIEYLIFLSNLPEAICPRAPIFPGLEGVCESSYGFRILRPKTARTAMQSCTRAAWARRRKRHRYSLGVRQRSLDHELRQLDASCQ